MAILIEGMECLLCGLPITKGQTTVSFPPFVANEADPLFRFNDGSFHSECLRKEPFAELAEARYAELKKHSTPENRRCLVCGKVITDPDDYIPFGHLTSDSRNPLHQLNYVHFHHSCLTRWPDLGRIYDLFEKELESGAWRGNGMTWLVRVLRDAQQQRSNLGV